MLGHFGFSYIGLLFLLLLFIPNVIWTRKKPQGYMPGKENKVLVFFERIGEGFTVTCVLVFDDFNLQGWSNRCWWLIGVFIAMAMYELWWIRYFRSERRLSDLLLKEH